MGFFAEIQIVGLQKKKKNVNLNQIGVGDSTQCQDQNIT